MKTFHTTEETELLINDHSESRKRIAVLKGRLEALSAALDLAAVHVDCAIQGMETPEMEQALYSIPSPQALISACEDYREEVRHSLELASRLAVLDR